MHTSKYKGIAFILNNKLFKHGSRKGSEKDVQNVKHVFQEIGYEVVVEENQTSQVGSWWSDVNLDKKIKPSFYATTTWIGWVENYFTNSTLKVWSDLDIPRRYQPPWIFHLREGIMQSCVCRLSGWNSARICHITRGQLSIDFVHRFFTILFVLDI